jgi:hypothetical protein
MQGYQIPHASPAPLAQHPGSTVMLGGDSVLNITVKLLDSYSGFLNYTLSQKCYFGNMQTMLNAPSRRRFTVLSDLRMMAGPRRHREMRERRQWQGAARQMRAPKRRRWTLCTDEG